ncbi:ABC transporter ATP-binding protein [Gordonia soli]|uniref:Putative ABC transporter permease/ATP-binding protein n=1 Tax=Gordonia soli NBRC 108243 TaxID=1223545 RepID=M0QI34_9ACTN|nr:ABC transporter ATP-binding protein [Gordonia soli]GAC68109.1 putative ABC transporter permease/ATP-binding protein [Gordonia soli NBRC 108243]
MTTPGDDPAASARAESAALKDMLQPVRGRLRLAQGVQLIGSAATVLPFIGIVELGRRLLAGQTTAGDIWPIVWLVIVGLGARAFFGALALGISHFADVDFQSHLRRRIVTKLGRLPLGWFTRTSSGEVRKSAQNDVHELHYLVAHADVETTAAVVTPVFALIYCFVLDWRLGLLAMATLPLYAAGYAWMIRDMTEQMARMNTGIERISATIVEFVSGVAVVKTFGQVGRAHRRFIDAADDFNDDFAGYVGPMLRIEAIAAMMLSAPLVLLVNLAGGYWFTSSGWVQPIEVVGATLIALVLPTSLMAITMALHSRQQAGGAARRLVDLFALPELPVSADPAVPQGNGVELEDVSFSYQTTAPASVGENGRSKALDGVDLVLPAGSLTALVGESGSGKSTLATLVPRFHDADTGSVRIGGVDVREIDPETLYRTVGFVLQDVQLLGISIRDNIRLGRPDATEEEVADAARAARIHDRIVALPRGYDAVIGDDAHFSGGESQRVSIARALLADTPILVLDEATAFADPESEAQIQQAISTLIDGRTVLVIAHRLGTITHADNIVVLDGGRVVEQGRHDDLVAAQGTYAAMWRSYTEGGLDIGRDRTSEPADVVDRSELENTGAVR